MKTLVAYPVRIDLSDIADSVVYLPELVKEPEDRFKKAIAEHKPDCIVVGNNLVDAKLIEFWRNLKGAEAQLNLVRRGSSLSRIDLEKAGKLGINVINTPGVNAPFAADYMLDNLKLDSAQGGKLAVIGSGGIGGRIAKKAAELGMDVVVYSPSLVNPITQVNVASKKGLLHPKISFAQSAEDAVIGATHIAIAVDAEKITSPDLYLSGAVVSSMSENVRIVSISELGVFSSSFLRLLKDRIEAGTATAQFDSNPADVKEFNGLGINCASVAMKGKGCQEAMDQAMLTVLAEISLKDLLKSGVDFAFAQPVHRRNTAITIVGAGINGLMEAYVLNRLGYPVTVVDSHDKPAYDGKFSYKGSTTLDGCDARHASVTETVPHAIPARVGVLDKSPLEGGWRILDKMSPAETEWARRFGEVALFPEAQSIFTRFVAQLNRVGISLWEDLFKSLPDIAQGSVCSTRIMRLYTSEQALDDGYAYQRNLHNSEDEVTRISKRDLEGMIPSLNKEDIAGGVEVAGHTVNLYELTARLQEFLETQGVEFRWSSRVKAMNNSRVVLESDETIDSQHVIVSTGVTGDKLLGNSAVNGHIQGVVGYWLELPNINNVTESFKIHEQDPIGVINVTLNVDKKRLLVSGGFGFTGKRDLRDFKSANLGILNDIFRGTIQRYFPDEYAEGISRGELETKFCVRPMTPDGMPIIGGLDGSKILFSGGTNAGGFVQSPVLSLIIAGCVQDDARYKLLAKALSPSRESLISA